MSSELKIGAAYIRVSTDDQLEYSPESQIKAIKDYAKAHEIFIPDKYIFQDDGISGRKADKRPGFQRMISTAKEKPAPFNIILVWKFSRFARNREDSIVYKSMLRKQCGIEVVSIAEPLGDDKTSVLMEAILEAMDEYYSINLGEEVKRGMTMKAEKGEPMSVPAYGYDIVEKKYVVNSKEAKIVKYIYTSYANGTPTRQIAIECNQMGARSHRGNIFESRTIDYILNNPVYIGKIRWNPNGKTRRNYSDPNLLIVDGHHEPIIDKELWKKTQDIIAKNRALYKKSEKPFHFSNMLQGIVRCSVCGGTLIKSGNYLQCQKYTKGMCLVSHCIQYDKAVQMIIDQVQKDFTLGKIENIKKIGESDIENEILKNQIKAEEKKLERIKDAYLAGADSIEEYKLAKAKILMTIKDLNKKLAIKKESPQNLVKKLVKDKKTIISRLSDENITIEEKNKILKSVLEKVVFKKESKELIFHYYL